MYKNKRPRPKMPGFENPDDQLRFYHIEMKCWDAITRLKKERKLDLHEELWPEKWLTEDE